MEEIASTSLAETSTPNLAESNAQSTRELFGADYHSISSPDDLAHQAKVATRIYQEYAAVSELPAALEAKMQAATASRKRRKVAEDGQPSDPKLRQMIEGVSEKAAAQQNSQALTVRARGSGAAPNANGPTPQRNLPSSALVRKDTIKQVKPEWHAPWKVFRVISGHMGWVRSVAMDPDNKFFVTGAADRTIKLWDLASGT
jgi:pleiotropic regulator 1